MKKIIKKFKSVFKGGGIDNVPLDIDTYSQCYFTVECTSSNIRSLISCQLKRANSAPLHSDVCYLIAGFSAHVK